MIAHFDCRYFSGYKPCMFKRECDGCPHYSPFGTRILVIKLAAMGDVLRCTALLRGLTRTYPGCHITWLTEANIVGLLKGIPEIDRLLTHDFESVMQLEHERFDQVYCFDKEPRATALAMKVRATRKFGFGMSDFGNVMPLNPESDYSFELGINDPLKFKINTKTYPELLFECAGIPYREPQEYLFPDLSAEIAEGCEYLRGLGVLPEDLKVGLNTGAGDAFATKKWTEEGYAQLAKRLVDTFGARVLLLGGPGESEKNLRIAAAANCPIVDTGGHHTIRTFAGIVGNCDLMVTGDTFAMHVGIGMKIPVLVILGSTCQQEIELYGRGAKVVSDFECSPCLLKVCPQEIFCMDAMSSEVVFDEAAKLLARLPKGVRKSSQAAIS